MATFKCKMCGGALEIQQGATVVECEYCGANQTLPKLDDEKRINLYDRANHFRRNNEFDKASAIYEQILNEDGTDSEAYWSLVLCRFGIEYVEDPTSQKRVPTVHRAQYTSIFDDDNYKLALENADSYQRIIYEEEAKAINEIQKGILAISQKEDPFDVFICYKETDNSGERTHDSVLAQDLYYELTEQGFKVFFSRITLEDKLGSAYEPYIFAALNSAKVMVVLGTKPEYFNAVWVKNEWSRYLSLIKNGAKKILIPAYRDMDPYDLPQEFSHLQAQDMSKLGFMQDLIRGINKLVGINKPKESDSTENNASSSTASNPLLVRAFIFNEDGDFKSGDEYCEKVLDEDPRCAEAYLGKLMIDMKVKKRRQLASVNASFAENVNYKRIMRFGSEDLVEEVDGYLEEVKATLLAKEEECKQETQRVETEKKALQVKAREQSEITRREGNEKRIAEITQQYASIPSDQQIEVAVKKSKSIKNWLIVGIIGLLLYWPVGVILLIVRRSKIKKAIKEEKSKYDNIRREYASLKSLGLHGSRQLPMQHGDLCELTVKKADQTYIWDEQIDMKIGNDVYVISRAYPITLQLNAGRKYSIEFSASHRKTEIDVSLTQNTTILLSWNKITGKIQTEIQ